MNGDLTTKQVYKIIGILSVVAGIVIVIAVVISQVKL